MRCDLQGQANREGYERDLEKTTSEAIKTSEGKAIFVQADVSNTQQVEEALRLAIGSEDLWSKMVAVNTLGTARMSRKAVRQLIEKDCNTNWGISSCDGMFGFPCEVAYTATKAFVNHMTKVGALNHANDYINFNCVAQAQNFENSKIHDVMRRATPWLRLGVAEDTAGAVSQWMTGQVISVDGGMTLGVSPTPEE
ncbi:hypothetical protein BKA56DRAFT_639600 [Ilyonectria sp. MPI-CAGE-AT-0026]|nr:hypothetical protein BKA56DRAFT_639600 [Ilyonectria sp. MPI-CAGE-AT-0026]